MNSKKIAAVAGVVFVLVCCVVVAGCTISDPSAADRPSAPTSLPDCIVGTWDYDMEYMVEILKDIAISFGTPEDELDMAELSGDLFEISLVFNADGTGSVEYTDADPEPFVWEDAGNFRIKVILDDTEDFYQFNPDTRFLTDVYGLTQFKKVA